MSIREKLSGNEAAATALRQMNPDVMAAFPITPSTENPSSNSIRRLLILYMPA